MLAPLESQSPHVRELAGRQGPDGLDVRLIWRPDDDAIFVAVTDPVACEQFAVRVDPSNAMDAFHHPYPQQTASACLTSEVML